MMIRVLAVAAILTPLIAFGNQNKTEKSLSLDHNQIKVINFAKETAINDGIKHPLIIPSILMQESKAGSDPNHKVTGPANGKCYGIGQIKLGTAKHILEQFPELWKYVSGKSDSAIVHSLKNDSFFSVRLVSKYLLILGINKNPAKAVLSYNRGPGGVPKIVNPDNFAYTKGVYRYKAILSNI